jgi:Zn-dependent peptidase ImmA (M78 family)
METAAISPEWFLNIEVALSSEHSENRTRFTIAHELGHIVLHQLDEIHIDKQFPLKLRDDISSQAIDPEEMEANAFAAALLMPEAMLKADLAAMEEMDCESDEDIQKLAIKYEVSPQAMNFRLMNLGLVSPVS